MVINKKLVIRVYLKSMFLVLFLFFFIFFNPVIKILAIQIYGHTVGAWLLTPIFYVLVYTGLV